MMFLLFCPTSLSVTVSGSIHVAADHVIEIQGLISVTLLCLLSGSFPHFIFRFKSINWN